MINADKNALWLLDVSEARAATDQWYIDSGRTAYQTARRGAVDQVDAVMTATDDLRRIEPAVLRQIPDALATLRMCTAPPVARERLAGLSRTERPLMTALEQGRLPAKVSTSELDAQLARVCAVLSQLLDRELFGWLDQGRPAATTERRFAATLVADRRCEAIGEQILRQAERQRQAGALMRWLDKAGYQDHPGPPTELPRGGYLVGPVGVEGINVLGERLVNAVIRPASGAGNGRLVVVKAVPRTAASSASGTTSAHAAQLRTNRVVTVLLIGVADRKFLHQVASAGLDWVWEHRLDDLSLVGL